MEGWVETLTSAMMAQMEVSVRLARALIDAEVLEPAEGGAMMRDAADRLMPVEGSPLRDELAGLYRKVAAALEQLPG